MAQTASMHHAHMGHHGHNGYNTGPHAHSSSNHLKSVQFAPARSLTENVALPQVIKRKHKHSGTPGSINATRVDFTHHETAFDASGLADTKEFKATLARRQEVQKFKQPRRLGEKPNWAASTTPPESTVPRRALMHTLSEFQTLRKPHNFRAMHLPTHYKDVMFVPKPTKFQIDRKLFLSPAEKDKLVDTNIKINMRVEHAADIDEDLGERERWDPSTQLHSDYLKEYYKKKEYSDMRSVTALRNEELLGESYIGPVQREKIRNQKMRHLKAQQRALDSTTQTARVPSMGYTLTVMRQEKAREAAAAAMESAPVQSIVPEEDIDYDAYGEDEEEYGDDVGNRTV